MGKNKVFLMICLAFLAQSVCFAKQISFQVVQHDNREDEVSEQSLIIEDELLNGFFEYGYIVTNSQAAISDSSKKDKDLCKIALKEAKEGYSEYLVQVKLYYENKKSFNGYTVSLKKIEWTLYDTKTEKSISNGNVDEIKDNATDEDIRKISFVLINDIKKALK